MKKQKYLFTVLLILMPLLAVGLAIQEASASQAGSTESSALGTPSAEGKSVTVGDGGAIKITGGPAMRFDVTRIEAPAGSEITIELTNIAKPDEEGRVHNLIVLKPGTDTAQFALAALEAIDNEYVPLNWTKSIVAFTGLAERGKTVKVTFTVPEEAGNYDYICTYPGHFFAGMIGVLVVK